MCIDGITYKDNDNSPFYILPDRDKAIELYIKCLEALYGKSRGEIFRDIDSGVFHSYDKNNEKTNWKKTAEFLRGDDIKLLLKRKC